MIKTHNMSSGDQKKFDMLKTLNSKSRLRILLFLFIYRKLSLTELSQRLGKTKNTVIYHIKRMVNYGIIQEEDEKIPNSINPSRCIVSTLTYISRYSPLSEIWQIFPTMKLWSTRKMCFNGIVSFLRPCVGF